MQPIVVLDRVVYDIVQVLHGFLHSRVLGLRQLALLEVVVQGLRSVLEVHRDVFLRHLAQYSKYITALFKIIDSKLPNPVQPYL